MYLVKPHEQFAQIAPTIQPVEVSVDAILELLFGTDTTERQFRLARIVLAREASIVLIPRRGLAGTQAMSVFEFLESRNAIFGDCEGWREMFRLEEIDGSGYREVHTSVMDASCRIFDVLLRVRSAATVRSAVDAITVVYDTTGAAAPRAMS